MLRPLVALIVAASGLLSSVTAGASDDAAERPGSAAGVIARQLLRTGDVTTDVLAACLGDWTERERIGQLIVPGVDYARLRDAVPLIEEGVIGGVVVLGRPGPDDATAVRNVLEELRAAAAVPPMIAVDEEGGRVQRLANVIGTLPSARSQAVLDPDEELVDLIREHGTALRELGFTVDLAPVLDVGGGPGIGNRSYGDDADSVVAATVAVADGLTAAGLLAVVKHFPGHGRASADSHLTLPKTPPIEELRAVDLLPFEHFVERGDVGVMVGHLDVPGLTDGRPASVSPEAVDGLLRGELGFDGLVLTDALNMGAVASRWTEPEAAELAIAAGVDVVLPGSIEAAQSVHSRLFSSAHTGALDTASIHESVRRVLAAKGVSPCEPLRSSNELSPWQTSEESLDLLTEIVGPAGAGASCRT